MLTQHLTKDSITLLDKAGDWKQAIRLAAAPLVKSGSVTTGYVEAMIASVEKSGPYIVIDDGLALPHARPQDGALRPDMSMLVLKTPVDLLGKPVSVFAVLAACDNALHLTALKELATLVWSGGTAEKLSSFGDEDSLTEFIKRILEENQC